jgi:hypothetical protein
MPSMNRKFWLLALMLFTFALCFAPPEKVKGQESSFSIRQRFGVIPAYRGCDPVEVKLVAFGRQPQEAVLAQVTIENRSDKVITAVKLGWKVYDEQEGRRMGLSPCSAPVPSVKALLTGTTPLIQLEALGPKETSNIGINPLPLPRSATKTVFVDRAFISVDDVKSLTQDRYKVVVFVSEIQYGDGTRWPTESN